MPDKKGADIDAVVIEPDRVHALTLAIALFEATGATNIRARLDGYKAPEVISGTLESHRPDLAISQSNALKTGMLLDVVLDPRTLNRNRIHLFQSAAQAFNADLGFILQSSEPDAEVTLRYRLAGLGVTPQKVIVIPRS